MSESFDPYAVFLGFPAGRAPRNYYELLGLPVFESDLEKISRAAEVLWARLHHIQPGAYRAQWQQMADELMAAKLCLLDPVAKATYDAYLQQGGVSSHGYVAPSPGGPGGGPSSFSGFPSAWGGGLGPSASSGSVAGWGYGAGVSEQLGGQMAPQGAGAGGLGGAVASYAPRYPASCPVGQDSADAGSLAWPGGQGLYPTGGAPWGAGVGPVGPGGYAPGLPMQPPLAGTSTSIAAKQAFAQRRWSIYLWVAGCGVLVGIAGVLLYLLLYVRTYGPIAKENPIVKNKPKISSSHPAQPNRLQGSKRSSSPADFSGEDSSKAVPPGLPSKGKPASRAIGQPEPDQPPSEPEGKSPLPKSQGPPLEKLPGLKPEKGKETPSPSQKPGPSGPEKPAGEPGGEKPPGSIPPVVDPMKQVAWQKAVGEVREALRQQDLALAREHLIIAERNAQTPAQQEEVEGLQMLCHYLEEFWKGIRQSVQSLEAGQELVVNNTRFAIVEGNQRYLIIRTAGRNLRWEIEKIPGSIVEILAKRWFHSNDPATLLAYGAYYAVRGDIQRAKQYWEKAAQMGQDVHLLVKELSSWPVPEP